jgi:hypothetical protein
LPQEAISIEFSSNGTLITREASQLKTFVKD